MLQLSDRYSEQSSVIFPPKSLRRMFESDYSINTGGKFHLTLNVSILGYFISILYVLFLGISANEPLVADHQVFTQPLSTKVRIPFICLQDLH